LTLFVPRINQRVDFLWLGVHLRLVHSLAVGFLFLLSHSLLGTDEPELLGGQNKTGLKKAELKKIGTVPLNLLAAPTPDRLILKAQSLPHVFVSSGSTDRELVFPLAPLKSGTSVHYATTPSAKQLFIRQNSLVNNLWVFDLTKSKVAGVEIPETQRFSIMPVVSPDDTQFLLFGISSAGGPLSGAWKFPLSEYLWDIEHNSAQPTGFYTESLQGMDFGSSVQSAAYSPDGSRLVLSLSPYGRSNRSGYSRQGRGGDYSEDEVDDEDYDDEGYGYGFAPGVASRFSGKPQLRIFDLNNRTSQEIPIPKSAVSLFWISEDVVVFRSEQAYLESGGLYRVTLSSKKVDRISSQPMSSEEVSSDGRFLLYSPSVSSTKGIPSLEVMDLTTSQKTSFENVVSAVFTPDVSELVASFSEKASADSKPFVRIPKSYFETGRKNERLDVAKEESLIRFGQHWDLYQLPHDPELFQENFVVDSAEISHAPLFIRLDVKVKNRGPHFMGSARSRSLDLRCQLLDPSGKELDQARSFGGNEFSRTLSITGPGDIIEFGCTFSNKIRNASASGGKVKYWLGDSEAVSRGEVAVP
jgi:hypothetical protein